MRAPARPALLPALLAMGAIALAAVDLRLPLCALPLCVVYGRYYRRIDGLLTIVAIVGGITVAEFHARHDDRVAMRLSFDTPIGQPFERDWTIRLTHNCRTLGDELWGCRGRSRGVAVHLEIVTRSATEIARLASLTRGSRVRLWARATISPDWRPPQPLKLRSKSSRLLVLLQQPQRPISRWRQQGLSRAAQLWRSPLFGALLFGERLPADEPAVQQLRRVGLSHLLAISGLHLSLIYGLLAILLWRAVAGGGGARLLQAISLALLVPLVGAGLPVQRAAALAGWMLIGSQLYRRGDALNSLALVALAMVTLDPSRLQQPGFCFSVTATAAILLVGRRGIGRASVAATIATMPLSAYFFGQLVPLAALVNLVALPLLAPLLACGYLAVMTNSDALASIAAQLLELLLQIAAAADHLPGTPWFVSPPTLLVTLSTLALCGLGALGSRLCRWLAAGALFALFLGVPPKAVDPPQATILDVGQGQAVLWHDADGRPLIDSGGQGWYESSARN